jgi:hypothetical protein
MLALLSRAALWLAVPFAALAAAASAQRVLDVVPGGTYPTPQAAIDFINTLTNPDQWVVRVTPGAYPGLTIVGGPMRANHISVVSLVQGQQYTLSGTPHVTIQNTSGQVTVADANWFYADGSAPSIIVSGCTGMVRLRNLDIELRSIFAGAVGRGVIEIDDSPNNMLLDVRMLRDGASVGFTLNPNVDAPPAQNDGLCGLVVRPGPLPSTVQLHECALIGYDNTIGAWGGDAVRVERGTPGSTALVWLTNYLQTTELRAGSGLVFGGSCFHDIAMPVSYLEACGASTPILVPGAGLQPGGQWTTDNQPAAAVAIPQCAATQWAHSDAPTTSSLAGGSINLTLQSNFGRGFAVYADLTPFAFGQISGFSGLLFLDPGTMFYLANGAVAASTPFVSNLPLPNEVSLIGRQFTFQSAFTAVGGNPAVLGSPSATTIEP